MEMTDTKPEIIELDAKSLEELRQRIDAESLRSEDHKIFRASLDMNAYLRHELEQKTLSIARLRQLIFGPKTEKTDALLGESTDSQTSPPTDETGACESDEETSPDETASKPHKGHGRNGVDAYTGAERIPVPHASLQPGDPCPECEGGTVYSMPPAVLIRFTGHAPIQAEVYERERLRCNLCGEVFTAPAPEGVNKQRDYDVTVGSMIALLKYGCGFPYNRLAGLQGNLGIPLPASTQCGIISPFKKMLEPILEELIRQAACGEVMYNDDTTNRILSMMGKRAPQQDPPEDGTVDPAQKTAAQRRGIYTTGIVSVFEGRRIALFFTGKKHAGENLADVLSQRPEDLQPPIQMCDALSRNIPADFKTILGNCLAHGRRRFAELVDLFTKECRYVLHALKVIYRNDAIGRQRELSPQERLEFHQANSGPTMDKLHAWLTRQFEDRLVEPNSALGKCITYLLNHWQKLTLFLRQAGAPLDNNICERALKKVIRHRKNSLFYRNQNGADTGDLFMSLIHTCEFCGANPLDYLNELQRHAKELVANPAEWLPWNYRQTLDGASASAATVG
jgi:hypothetical protein